MQLSFQSTIHSNIRHTPIKDHAWGGAHFTANSQSTVIAYGTTYNPNMHGYMYTCLGDKGVAQISLNQPHPFCGNCNSGQRLCCCLAVVVILSGAERYEGSGRRLEKDSTNNLY